MSKGKPDIASLDQFASIFRRPRLGEGKARDKARPNTVANSTRNAISEVNHEHTIPSRNLPTPPGRPNTELIAPSIKEDARSASKEPGADEVARTNLNGSIKLNNVTTLNHDALPEVYRGQSNSGIDVGQSSNTQNIIQAENRMLLEASQPTLTQAPNHPSGPLGISSKGIAPKRPPDSRTVQIHIPRSRLDRLRKIRVANSETTKVEDVEFSTINREKLRNLSRVLSSKKDQIELFGKELPLCRASLVQVTECNDSPAAYICIQGLRSPPDITRFHTVMSHKR